MSLTIKCGFLQNKDESISAIIQIVSKIVRPALMHLIFIVFISSSHAATVLWHGDVDNDWNNPLNWAGNTLPTSADRALINPASFAYTFAPILSSNSAFTPERINLRNGGEFSINGGTISVIDDLNVYTGSTFTINAGTVTVNDNFKIRYDSNFIQNSGTLICQDFRIGQSTDVAGSGSNSITLSGANIVVNEDVELYADDNDISIGGESVITIIDKIDFRDSSGNDINIFGSVVLNADDTDLNIASTTNTFMMADDAQVTITQGDANLTDSQGIAFFVVNDNSGLVYGALTLPVNLPVELLYMRANMSESNVRLTWATATEIDNDHFLVQRSADGLNYETIERVEGNGNSREVIKYEYLDERPILGVNYYRLEQVDYDGQYETFAPVSVTVINNEAHSTALKVWPNPTENRVFNIAVPTTLDATNNQVMVFDTLGRLVYETSNVLSSNIKVDLNHLNINSGIYLITYADEFGSSHSRVKIL